MPEFETFPDAPIVEAILEIVVDTPEGTNVEDLKAFPPEIKAQFSSKTVHKRIFKGKFKVGPQVESLSSEDELVGFALHSDEQKKVIQSRLNGFAFSKLKPYESWEVFRTEARKIWNEYRKIARPIKIKRISLRYINRIEIPFPFGDFNEYILTNPVIAPDLPQGVTQLLMRLQIPVDSIGGVAIVILTLDESLDKNKLPLIFDIDIICDRTYEKDMEQIWDKFEKLRDCKNEFFFKSVTEKAKELFR